MKYSIQTNEKWWILYIGPMSIYKFMETSKNMTYQISTYFYGYILDPIYL